MAKPIVILLIAQLLCAPVAAESLYVFVPSEVRANKIQQQIGGYCRDVDVTVFGRAKDFHNRIKQVPPNAILSLSPVVKQNHLFDPAILGYRNGVSNESYVLVSVEKSLKLTDLHNKKIGVVDLLGRKPMAAFIDGILKTQVKLKRVTKVEDLLPLITFDAVDAIFISTTQFVQFKAKSQLNLVATPLDIKIGLASAALKDSLKKEKLSQCLLAFDKQLNLILGVDQWQTL